MTKNAPEYNLNNWTVLLNFSKKFTRLISPALMLYLFKIARIQSCVILPMHEISTLGQSAIPGLMTGLKRFICSKEMLKVKM